jgi:gluconolactonase
MTTSLRRVFPSSRRAFCHLAVAAGAMALARRAAGAAPAEQAAPPSVKSFKGPYEAFGEIERLDPALDKLLPKEAKLEKLAEGFDWSEGPVWVKKGKFLLFSDIPPNTIYKWKEGTGITVFMRPAGYSGARTDMKEPGTNGLALDRKGNLVMCQHGNRRLARLEAWASPQGNQTALAEKYDGKRLNSPNDLAIHSRGDIFFTDPPYGLAKNVDDPEKEIKFQGVYRLDPKGVVHLLHDGLERPNGIALSPDEKTLYVANSHGPRPIIMAFEVKPDLSVDGGRVFFDGAELVKKGRKGAFDGMKVDKKGNLWATGPGGVLVLSREGKHLGTILTGQATANCAFGEDGKTLFVTADMFLGRIRTTATGVGF